MIDKIINALGDDKVLSEIDSALCNLSWVFSILAVMVIIEGVVA